MHLPVLKKNWKSLHTLSALNTGTTNNLHIRAGYFHEASTKEIVNLHNRCRSSLQCVWTRLCIPIPTTQRNPLENTLRFTLIFDFEGKKRELRKYWINHPFNKKKSGRIIVRFFSVFCMTWKKIRIGFGFDVHQLEMDVIFGLVEYWSRIKRCSRTFRTRM